MSAGVFASQNLYDRLAYYTLQLKVTASPVCNSPCCLRGTYVCNFRTQVSSTYCCRLSCTVKIGAVTQSGKLVTLFGAAGECL